MANAIEKNEFTQNVYLVEQGDKVIGGADAPINQPLQALANRTNNLNIRLKAVDKKISENTDTVKITGDQTINGDKTFGGNAVFTKGSLACALRRQQIYPYRLRRGSGFFTQPKQ